MSTGPSLVLDGPAMQSQFFQPANGAVDVFLAPVFSPEVLAVESAISGLADYHVSGYGTGMGSVERVIEELFAEKLQSRFDPSIKAWNSWVMLTLNARFYSTIHEKEAADLGPSGLTDIHPELESIVGPQALEQVHTYTEMLRNQQDLGTPLYITGDALCDMGANPFIIGRSSLWMLDGAKRIMAQVLNHTRDIRVRLIMTESQYQRLLPEERRSSLVSQIADLAWFQNYQSIPLVGLAGQRTSSRYQLIDTKEMRGKRVLDFGCNTGEACLRAAQVGASEAIGLDVMPDTLSAAMAIHDLCPFPNLRFHQINFNDPNFAAQVDQVAPGQVDYSFFFSVYRTLELTQRDALFQYVLDKSRLGVYFEGHGDSHLDRLEFYADLFKRFRVRGQFLGYTENGNRPLFFIDRTSSADPRIEIPSRAPAVSTSPRFGHATPAAQLSESNPPLKPSNWLPGINYFFEMPASQLVRDSQS